MGDSDISDSINHYLDKHGYRLLHVGTETSRDDADNIWYHTVAVLGHDNPPALKPPTTIKLPEFMRRPTAHNSPTGTGTAGNKAKK